jgi:hypothetical protein
VSTRGARFYAGQPLVGSTWWHGASDRREALAQLRGDFDNLRADLSRADGSPVAPALAPTIAAFDAFYQAEMESTLAPWITEWSVFEAWKERIAWARMAARAAGVQLMSPEPVSLPKTTWERGEDGTGDRADRAFVFGRNAVKIGLGLAAAFGIWKFGRRVWRVLEQEKAAIEELAEREFEHHEHEREREHEDHHRAHEHEDIEDAELVE